MSGTSSGGGALYTRCRVRGLPLPPDGEGVEASEADAGSPLAILVGGK